METKYKQFEKVGKWVIFNVYLSSECGLNEQEYRYEIINEDCDIEYTITEDQLTALKQFENE